MRALLLAFCAAAVVAACTDPKVPQEVAYAAHYAACDTKGSAVSRLPLRCADRVALLEALVRYDEDCQAIFGDAGPGVSCEEPNAYPPGYAPADAGSE